MRLSEIKRMLLDHENRLRVFEGRALVNKSYKAPLENDVLTKEPIKNPEPIEVEEPKEVKKDRFVGEVPKATTPRPTIEEPIEDKEQPSEEQPKDLKPKEDIKEDNKTPAVKPESKEVKQNEWRTNNDRKSWRNWGS